MKTIGLIGGMSWESTEVYYRYLNEGVKERLGEPHSCSCLLYSVDFAQFKELQHQGDWEQLGRLMAEIAGKLELAGADFLMICANTMHKLAAEVSQAVDIPLLHIAEATVKEIKKKKIKRVALLGTRFTMEEKFYRQRLEEKGDLEVIIPESRARHKIHQIIYQELISGKISATSREKMINIIAEMPAIEGVILGCTELPLLLTDEDIAIPIFDTMKLHAKAAVEKALN